VQLLGRRLLQLAPRRGYGYAPSPLHSIQRGEVRGERGAVVGSRGGSPARGASTRGSRSTPWPVWAPGRARGMARAPGRRRRRIVGTEPTHFANRRSGAHGRPSGRPRRGPGLRGFRVTARMR
jgi:hypothetical protein